MPNIKNQYFGSTRSDRAGNVVTLSSLPSLDVDLWKPDVRRPLGLPLPLAPQGELTLFPFDSVLSYQWVSGVLANSFLSYFIIIVLTGFILSFLIVALTWPFPRSRGKCFTCVAYSLTPVTKKNLSFVAFFSFPSRKVLNLFVDKCFSSRMCPARIIFLMGNLMGPPTDRGDHPICTQGQETLPARCREMQQIRAWCIFIAYSISEHLFLKIFLLKSLVVSPSGTYQASPLWGKSLLRFFPFHGSPVGREPVSLCLAQFHAEAARTHTALSKYSVV